jgi:hypothetical protein
MRFCLTLVVVLAGCGSARETGAPVQTATIKSTVAPKETLDLTRELLVKQARYTAGREKVWNAMVEVHGRLGIPMLAGDVVSGSATYELANKIRTVAGKPASRYIDCGNGPVGPRADSYRLVIKLTHVFENPTPESTVVTTTMQAWARNPGMSSDPIPCSSNGMLETEIGGMMATRLN